VDHVVIPLDDDHARSLRRLRRVAQGPSRTAEASGHVTLVAYVGLDRAGAAAAVRRAVGSIEPFFVRAHGYGFFVGDEGDASLHVPVVRDQALNELHASVTTSLREAGAVPAGWTDPAVWSPHITVIEGGLDGDGLAAVVAALARRHHPSWRVPVSRLEIVGGRDERRVDGICMVPFAGRTTSVVACPAPKGR
jgi:2'-5' RNA ligase